MAEIKCYDKRGCETVRQKGTKILQEYSGGSHYLCLIYIQNKGGLEDSTLRWLILP